MTDDKKPREFWLYRDYDEEFRVYDEPSDFKWDHSFHVIEHSAYANLLDVHTKSVIEAADKIAEIQKENERLKEILDNQCECSFCVSHREL